MESYFFFDVKYHCCRCSASATSFVLNRDYASPTCLSEYKGLNSLLPSLYWTILCEGNRAYTGCQKNSHLWHSCRLPEVWCDSQPDCICKLSMRPSLQIGCCEYTVHLCSAEARALSAFGWTSRYTTGPTKYLCFAYNTFAHTSTHSSCKHISVKALEQNDYEQSAYMNHIGELITDPAQLMFIDEAACNKKNPAWKMGWSLAGTRCVQHWCFVHGQKFSILPVLMLDGIITHNIIPGSVTSETFVDFLREHIVSLNISIGSWRVYLFM